MNQKEKTAFFKSFCKSKANITYILFMSKTNMKISLFKILKHYITMFFGSRLIFLIVPCLYCLSTFIECLERKGHT